MTSRVVYEFLILSTLSAVALAAAPATQPAWMLPREEAQKWAARVRQLAPAGWTVTVDGNDIVLGREKPARFARDYPNAQGRVAGQPEPPPDLHEDGFRLTLRFGPKLSIDEYERRAAVNAASEKERDRLTRELNLPHEFDSFIASTPEEEERLRRYREATAKLPSFDLPDLYTPDHSITLILPADAWSYVYDEPVRDECERVKDAVLRYFGTYDPAAAAGRQAVGRPAESAAHP